MSQSQRPANPSAAEAAAAAGAVAAAAAGAPLGAGRAAVGTRLDPWLSSYAERTRSMTASEIRALFAVANRPEVVSLAGGMPYLPALPLDVIAGIAQRLIAERGAVALQYGSGQGEEVLREQIVQVMREQQIHASPEDVVVTTGSQQALDLVARVFLDPGDVVVAEAPSYVGALNVFRSYQADVVHVPLDADGLQPQALEEALVALEAAGRRAKFLYTVPNHHNPAGVTLSAARRPQVLEVARRHGLLVLEDDPYALLGFDGDPLPAMRSLDADGVIHLGSFSKTLAPGFRLGWAVAPHAVREKLVMAAEASVLCPTSFGQLAVAEYLSTYDWKGQVKTFRELYRERRDATLQALATHLPMTTWTQPKGGFYVWVTLPEGLDATAMLPRAVTARVAYVPGTAFYADDQGRQHLRLSYCFPTAERIQEGVRRLAGVVQAELETQAMFGTPLHGHPHLHHGSGDAPGPELA
ncbi:DNA-binding transcriptional MocR family regulator [Kineococcus xinjiangensis]|uniref:DNA-binding transcriptional MocR family regulator n=1 Tax=Kineococcus xinjiangensis TaxID=512762 RepID=A0A2S6IHZ5_9ACTN|nr:PLP-dependent aminotransferase family protein [Kineococcus xinjiangensis]PPK93842.1 DNA-binding transcriptional MocR family regulator [Kineococcus xinjiangensis]